MTEPGSYLPDNFLDDPHLGTSAGPLSDVGSVLSGPDPMWGMGVKLDQGGEASRQKGGQSLVASAFVDSDGVMPCEPHQGTPSEPSSEPSSEPCCQSPQPDESDDNASLPDEDTMCYVVTGVKEVVSLMPSSSTKCIEKLTGILN